MEAEQQISLLCAPEGDAEVTKWLAQSLVMQRVVSEFQDRDPSNVDKQKDYWKWLAAQPVGQVLCIAVQANPDDVETANLFLSVFNQRSAWFGNATPESRVETEKLAKQTIERLVAKKENGRAQLVAYANTAIADREKATAILKEALEPAFARLVMFQQVLSNNLNTEHANGLCIRSNYRARLKLYPYLGLANCTRECNGWLLVTKLSPSAKGCSNW